MKEQLEKAYLAHRQNLLAIARNITGCRNLAEDAIQSAFSMIIRRQLEIDDLTGYVFRSVRNAAIDLVRRRSRDSSTDYEFEDRTPGSELGGADTTLLLEKRSMVKQALEELPESDRELILLKIFADLTFAQIAEITSVSGNTVATRYRRLLEKLRTRLREANE